MYWLEEPLVGHAAPQHGPHLIDQGQFNDSMSYSSIVAAAQCCSDGYCPSGPILSRAGQPYTAMPFMQFNNPDERQRRYMSTLWTGQSHTEYAYPHSMPAELSGTIENRLMTSQSASVDSEASPSSIRRHHASFSSIEESPIEKRDTSEYATSSSDSQASPFTDNPTNHLSHDNEAERPEIAGEPSPRHLLTCGNDPRIQNAVRVILESREYQDQKDIPFESMAPLLKGCGKGKRGAPTSYRCLWGGCGTVIPRKLHAKEHIMAHLDHRLHVCADCGSGFVRKNELKKHLDPCKRNKGRNFKSSDQRSRRIRRPNVSCNLTPGNETTSPSGPVGYDGLYQSVVPFNPSPASETPLSGTFYQNPGFDMSRSNYQQSPIHMTYYPTSVYSV